MEEAVGIRWHKLITRLAGNGFPAAQIHLDDEGPRLAMVFRALSGDPGLTIKASTERSINTWRPLAHRLAGTGRRHALAWREADALRVPESLAVFPDKRMNRDLYLWLTAMASLAESDTSDDWLQANQQLVLKTLAAYPGLTGLYQRLAECLVDIRRAQRKLPAIQAAREAVLQAALLTPDNLSRLPAAPGEPWPVPLWLYPRAEEVRSIPSAANDDGKDGESNGNGKVRQSKQRKQGRYIDDPNKRNGLMIFRLESLFSWSEFVPVDRCEDDQDDDDAERIAEDLDYLTLSRNPSTSASRIKLDMDLPSASEDDIPLTDGCLFPEWDWKQQQLKDNHCRVIPMLPRNAEPAPMPERLGALANSLRQRFEGLRPQRVWEKRQPSGALLDLDACLHHAAQVRRGRASSHPALWRRETARHRDLSCLVLADLSLSTEAWADNTHQVIEVIRDSLHLLGEALDAGQDDFAMYGFSSRRRDHVRFNLIKNFAEPWSEAIHGRIKALKPGYYTRMGAAIRQATDILKDKPAEQRLLLLLTDGKPNDLDVYEGRYGMEDTRQALLEARQAGIQPFCVTIDQQAADYLPYLFGQQRYQLIHQAAELPSLLPKLYLLLTGRAN
ncbi:nitric oxide reductase activation protein NorD [Halopseudomonas bauzanensis]|uniref:Nitric oxide reductase NorD protein n=1 Tax=Halopseudomonas bauzanensis TaxID=653930 RepID=A0A1I4JFT6_9GAMM|nr:VWA domain-containing protein [Halopseudomonas bauzanensis]TKA90861.1 VWA domain-containing protein [Halopseudomonas bauzanensis]SER60518.1 nitric oxide reductase NorD protein [Halopseudomonas bauzanensis]SFL65420.1 nitric oxide reductase NorD protein [Halopseudomonas bauzanensis]